MVDYKGILENLGYKLTDRGDYWHSAALYRGGNNLTALQIYKNSGVWRDFVEDTEFMPFEALIEKSANTKDKLKIREILNKKGSSVNIATKERNLLREEKTYDPNCLKKLLPHYDFYTTREKSISEATLKDYQCGLSTGGKLYQRIVFPVFNKAGRIHGFSGRKVSNEDERPKWLHVGKKNTWFYPYHTIKEIPKAISENRCVYLVESIGDSLALYDKGIKNNLVCFGLNMSPKFISNLSCLDVDRIYISLNNDSNKKINRGFEAAFKVFCKLTESLDYDKIYFAPPTGEDFGEMNKEQIEKFKKDSMAIDHSKSMLSLIEVGENMCKRLDKPPKALIAALNKQKKQYKFNYE
ncbi:hypothetical protein N9955_01005 [bacterium]|nr:hypothetical protein [bacterium]